MEKKEDIKTSDEAIDELMRRKSPYCQHEWRVVEGLYSESSRTRRTYCAYCVYCLKSKAVEIINEEEK